MSPIQASRPIAGGAEHRSALPELQRIAPDHPSFIAMSVQSVLWD